MSTVVAYTGETRVNTTRVNLQNSPSVTVLANGGWVVTWQSFNQDGDGYGIYQQRYGANGQPVGGEILVNTTTVGWQVLPSVTGLKDGGWVVTWSWVKEIENNPRLHYVSQQRYDTDGWKVGGEIQVSTDTANEKGYSSVTALATGGWVVTWQSRNQDGSQYGIHQQRYGADGHPIGAETRVNATTLGDQTRPSVTGLTTGGWIVTWGSDGQDGEGYGIYQQRYDADGWTVGGETRVNFTTASEQSDPSVAGLAGGGWVVTWTSMSQDGSGAGVYQQRYGANGLPVGAETLVNTTTSGQQLGSSVTALAGGGWLVTWQSAQDGSGYGVYQQRYDANGAKVGDEAQVNTFTPGEQGAPTVTALSTGGWVVAWTSNGQDGDGAGVFQQIYSAVGQQIGPSTPTGLSLSASAVQEGALATASIGQLAAKALDPSQNFTYTLLDDASGRFALVGSRLVVKDGVRLDHEQTQSHLIKVEVQDSWDVTHQSWFTVTVTDVTSENLTGTVGSDVLKGGKYKDTFKGGAGHDKLWGGLGSDTLYGGTGKDVFVFDTKPNRKTNFDRIVDFVIKDDTLWLDNKVFTKLGKGTEAKPGKLNKAFFTLGDKAKDKNDYLVFNPKNGVLSYDIDGSGTKAAVEIALLKKGLKLTYADFFVI